MNINLWYGNAVSKVKREKHEQRKPRNRSRTCRQFFGPAATAERIIIKIGKVGLVLVVIATAALAWATREEMVDLDLQVDSLFQTAYSPDRAWVAREVVTKGGTDLFPGPGVPTGKFVCGRAGSVPIEFPPDPYEARTTGLCVLLWTAEGWPKTVRPVGVPPAKFGVPELCPESILHPEKGKRASESPHPKRNVKQRERASSAWKIIISVTTEAPNAVSMLIL